MWKKRLDLAFEYFDNEIKVKLENTHHTNLLSVSAEAY